MTTFLTQMGLYVWQNGEDPYDHDDLASNFIQINNHDHSGSGKGVQIPTAGIANGAITEGKLAGDSVTTPKIANGAVTGIKIPSDSITLAHMTNASIGTSELVDLSVTTEKLAPNAVTGTKLAPNSVDRNHIIDGEVGSAKLAGQSVTRTKIGPAAVGETELDNSIVSSAKIQTAAVSGAKIQSAAIGIANDGQPHLASNSVYQGAMQDNSVGTAEIINNSVTKGKIAVRDLDSETLADNAVNSRVLADGAVDTAAILDGNVTTPKLSQVSGSEAVSTATIRDNAVTSAKIANGTIMPSDLNNSVLPLGSVIMWWAATAGAAVPTGWEIADGRAWSAVTNDLGLTSGNMPNLVNKFVLGAAAAGTGSTPTVPPALGGTGGAHSRDLRHGHSISPHTHAVGNHTHNVTTLNHAHSFNGGDIFRTTISRFQSGITVVGPLDAQGNRPVHNNSLRGVYFANQTLPDNDPLNMDPAGAATVTSAGVNAGSDPTGPASASTTVTASSDGQQNVLSDVDLRPAHVGLYFLIKVRAI